MDNGATFRTTQTIDIGPAGTCAAVAGQPDTFGRIDRCRRRKRKALGKRVGEKEATPEGRGRGVRRHGTEERGVHALSAAQRRAQAVHYFLRTEGPGAVDYLLGDDSGSAVAASPGKQSACTHAPSQDADARPCGRVCRAPQRETGAWEFRFFCWAIREREVRRSMRTRSGRHEHENIWQTLGEHPHYSAARARCSGTHLVVRKEVASQYYQTERGSANTRRKRRGNAAMQVQRPQSTFS